MSTKTFLKYKIQSNYDGSVDLSKIRHDMQEAFYWIETAVSSYPNDEEEKKDNQILFEEGIHSLKKIVSSLSELKNHINQRR